MSLRPTNRGSSQQGGTEQPGQKAPQDRGLFSQCEQHIELPGGTVEQVFSTITSLQQQ